MNWVREHPYLSGSLIVAVIILFLVLRGRSSSSSSAQQVSQGGPSDALQAAGLQAQTQQSAISAQVALGQIAANSQDTATQAARDVALSKVAADFQSQQFGTAAALQAAQAGYMSQVDLADISAGRDISLSHDQLAAVGINASAAVDIAGIQGDVTKAQTAAALAAQENTNLTALQISTQQGNVALNENITNVQG